MYCDRVEGGTDLSVRSLRTVLGKRDEFIRSVVAGLVLGLGLNLLASGITGLRPTFSQPTELVEVSRPHQFSLVFLIAGAMLIVIFLGYTAYFYIGARTIKRRFTGVVTFDRSTLKLVRIPEYKLNNRVATIVEAALSENAAYKDAWESDPLEPPIDPNKPPPAGPPAYLTVTKITQVGDNTKQLGKAAALLQESLEFVILRALSVHLSDYFRATPDLQKYIQTHPLTDFPEFILGNRILSLLTAPLEDRPNFLDIKDKQSEGELQYVWRSDGSVYSRIELVLPKGSQLTRKSLGHIEIKSKSITISLVCKLLPYRCFVENRFINYYMGVKNPRTTAPRQVKIEFQATVHPTALFARNGAALYGWLDSFADSLKTFSDFPSFLESINWPTLSALLHIIKNQSNRAPALANKQEHKTDSKPTIQTPIRRRPRPRPR